MKITDCQILFTATLAATRISHRKSTPMNKIAALVLEMARAYESDGITFFVSDDPVNALASLYYGSGWLHFGLASGMLTITPLPDAILESLMRCSRPSPGKNLRRRHVAMHICWILPCHR